MNAKGQDAKQPAQRLSRSQEREQFNTHVRDAEIYLEELIANPPWYSENEGRYITISAHPRAYVTAQEPRLLREQKGYRDLGIWYQCRVDVDPEKRYIPNHSRPRQLRRTP